MEEVPKQFAKEFIDLHLANLPDAKTYEEDDIEHQIFEGFDSEAELRPGSLTVLYLVFSKNADKNGWELTGYHY